MDIRLYPQSGKEREDLRIAGCWVHARRKFDEAMNVVPKEQRKKSNAYLVMKQIQAIYREEGKLQELLPDERLMQRQLVIKPLVDALICVPQKNGTNRSLQRTSSKGIHIYLESGEIPPGISGRWRSSNRQ